MSGNNLRKKINFNFGIASAILVAVFAVLLTADLVLKYCAVRYDWEFTVIPRLIEVVSVQYNSGAAFSFLADKPWAQTFFIVLTFIMLVLLVLAFLALPKRFVILKTAVAMVAAGAVGNLVDRMLWQCVRDFVDVNIFGSVACCNFADFWIVFGVILAIIDILFLNEWSVIPLTKSAKAAQAAEKERKAEGDKENTDSVEGEATSANDDKEL